MINVYVVFLQMVRENSTLNDINFSYLFYQIVSSLQNLR